MPDTPPTSRRRRFRLSVRGLILLVLVVGGGLGWKLHRVRVERQAVAVIRAAGGGVRYEVAANSSLGRPRPIGTPLAQTGPAWLRRRLGDDFFRPVVSAEVPEVRSPEVLAAIGRLDGLVLINVRCPASLPDWAWEPLAGLTRLEEAHFQGPGVTDAAPVAIGEIASIRSVSFNGNAALTDAGLAALAKLPALEDLYMNSCTNLTDAGVGRMLAASRSRALDRLVWSGHRGSIGATIRSLGEHHPRLRSLELEGGPTADADLAPLGKLTSLARLSLGGVPFSDAGVIYLEPLVNLQSFTANFGGVSDGGMKPLGRLRSLDGLYLSGSKFGDAGLAHLAGLTHLTRLSLRDSLVTGAGLKSLAGFKDLLMLDLSRTAVDDSGLAEIAGLAKLKDLDLTRTRLSDAGVATLARSPSLLQMMLNETQVTDAALDELKRLASLRRLMINATQVTPGGIARFRAARPNVKVGYLPPATPRQPTRP